MAEKLCGLRKKSGGGLKETVLWTNNAPTSDLDAQTVTLSDDITKYKYIAVNYNYSSTNTTEQYQYQVIMPVSVFVKSVYPVQNYIPQMQLGVYSSIANVRTVMYVSATSVRFSPANNVGQTGTSNNRCIPTSIVGLK